MISVKSLTDILLSSAEIMTVIYVVEIFVSGFITKSFLNLGYKLLIAAIFTSVLVLLANILGIFLKSVRKYKSDSITYVTCHDIRNSSVTYAVFLAARSMRSSQLDFEMSLILMYLAVICAVTFIIITFWNSGKPRSIIVMSANYFSFVASVFSIALFATPGMMNFAFVSALIAVVMVIISSVMNLMNFMIERKSDSRPAFNCIESRSDNLDHLEVIDEIAKENTADRMREPSENSSNSLDCQIREPSENSSDSLDCESKKSAEDKAGYCKMTDSPRNSAEEVLDELNYHAKLINECVDFLMSNNSNSVFYK